MNEIVHIEYVTGVHASRCGSMSSRSAWISAGRWVGGKPTCETCILLHWANPADTFMFISQFK